MLVITFVNQAMKLESAWRAACAASIDLWYFGLKQAWACLFGGTLLALILLTDYWYPFHSLHRYDFLFIAAVVIQLALLLLKLETLEEAKVIVAFHLIAMVMEVFKTSKAIGAWQYPGEAVLRIGHVPLFAGFMYSAVGSYIARIWRILDFRFSAYPPAKATWVLAALIYLNFFTHHFTYDIRWPLLIASLWMFGGTWIEYTPYKVTRRMPLVVGWFLVALFIWLAENIGTFARIWVYPSQEGAWTPVSPEKILAWYLLMLISFILVAVVHRPVVSKHPAGTAQTVHEQA